MQKTLGLELSRPCPLWPHLEQDHHEPVFQIRKPALMRDSRLPGTGGSTSRAVPLCGVSQGHRVREYGSHHVSGPCTSCLGSHPSLDRCTGHRRIQLAAVHSTRSASRSSEHSTCYFQPERARRPGVWSSQGARAHARLTPAAHGGSGLAPRGAAPDGGTEAGGARTQLPAPESVLRAVMKSEQERQSRPRPGRAPVRKTPQEGGCPPPLHSGLGRPPRANRSRPAWLTPGAGPLRPLSTCPRDPRLWDRDMDTIVLMPSGLHVH